MLLKNTNLVSLELFNKINETLGKYDRPMYIPVINPLEVYYPERLKRSITKAVKHAEVELVWALRSSIMLQTLELCRKKRFMNEGIVKHIRPTDLDHQERHATLLQKKTKEFKKPSQEDLDDDRPPIKIRESYDNIEKKEFYVDNYSTKNDCLNLITRKLRKSERPSLVLIENKKGRYFDDIMRRTTLSISMRRVLQEKLSILESSGAEDDQVKKMKKLILDYPLGSDEREIWGVNEKYEDETEDLEKDRRKYKWSRERKKRTLELGSFYYFCPHVLLVRSEEGKGGYWFKQGIYRSLNLLLYNSVDFVDYLDEILTHLFHDVGLKSLIIPLKDQYEKKKWMRILTSYARNTLEHEYIKKIFFMIPGDKSNISGGSYEELNFDKRYPYEEGSSSNPVEDEEERKRKKEEEERRRKRENPHPRRFGKGGARGRPSPSAAGRENQVTDLKSMLRSMGHKNLSSNFKYVDDLELEELQKEFNEREGVEGIPEEVKQKEREKAEKWNVIESKMEKKQLEDELFTRQVDEVRKQVRETKEEWTALLSNVYEVERDIIILKKSIKKKEERIEGMKGKIFDSYHKFFKDL